ncbi:MAG: hypothetical protein H6838_17320 [Planctomycetes bacterium]|nr:hypothetical protein [Planctomycetota bacterium]
MSQPPYVQRRRRATPLELAAMVAAGVFALPVLTAQTGQGITPGQQQGQSPPSGAQYGPFPGTGTGLDAQGRPLTSPRILTSPQPQDPPLAQDRLDPIWSQPLPQPTFQGFPSFSSNLFGAYPKPGGVLEPGAMIPQLPKLGPSTGWPAWVVARSKEPLPDSPELAMLVRHSDRVWRRERADEPFTPLYHYDRLGTLRDGAEIEVRQTGEFEILFQDSARLVSSGPAELRIVSMTEAAVAVEVRYFTALRLLTVKREYRLVLPDGTLLVVPGDPAEGPPPGRAEVVLLRAAEGDDRPGRATVFQGGDRPARLVFASDGSGTREAVLENGHRVTVLLQPRREGQLTDGGLDAGALVPIQKGAAVEFTGGAQATVQWSGAAFRVPPGQTLLLDPLQGRPFAPPQ